MILGTVAGKYKEANQGFPKSGFIEMEANLILHGSVLYVRKCYVELHTIIRKNITHSCITGVPGIGKSCLLIYFVLRLLFDSTDADPNDVIFEVESKECYYFPHKGPTRSRLH